jgi:hypothetical protein
MSICYSVNPRRQLSDRVVRKFKVFSISWLVCVSALAAGAAQKPVREVEIHADGFTAPETLDELWEQSAIVIDGRIVDVRPANETFTPTLVFPALPQVQQSKQVRALSQTFQGDQGFRAGVLPRRRS